MDGDTSSVAQRGRRIGAFHRSQSSTTTTTIAAEPIVLFTGGHTTGGSWVDDYEVFGGPGPCAVPVTYNEEIFADFTLAGTGGVVSKVVLMRPGSVTHHFDQDQRYIQLPTAVFGNSVSFLMPANSNVAPKGFYMVFLLTSDGTPSVARWINLQ